MINSNINKALEIIVSKLDKHKIIYAVIGSANLALQGLKIKPKDIDIVVKLKDLSRIKKLFLIINQLVLNN